MHVSQAEGLKDGGHVYPTCSNCRAKLMDIFITRPHEKDIWKVRCNCPFCGDQSFITEVPGGFHYGGFALANPEDDSDDKPSTLVQEDWAEGDVFYFKIIKANPDAKPIY